MNFTGDLDNTDEKKKPQLSVNLVVTRLETGKHRETIYSFMYIGIAIAHVTDIINLITSYYKWRAIQTVHGRLMPDGKFQSALEIAKIF